MNSLFLIIYVALFAIILNYLTRKEYTTHEKGGIVISGFRSIFTLFYFTFDDKLVLQVVSAIMEQLN